MQLTSKGKYTYRDATMVTDTGGTGLIDTVGDIAIVDVSDMQNVSIVLNQIVDNGTIGLVVDYSVDGVNWIPNITTKIETDFPVGNNVTKVAYTLSDAQGMPLFAKQVRVTCSIRTGTGSYTMGVSGQQSLGYR